MGFITWAGAPPKQPPLFSPDEDEQLVPVTVSGDGTGGYLATIAGGWWMATGATREAAIRAVMARYEGER